MFLAVLPAYRTNCIDLVLQELGDEIEFVVSEAHLDPTVRTGIPTSYYRRAPMLRLAAGRIFIQFPPSWAPLASKSVILDLNPRSLSAWVILLVRRLLRRRTLMWGHVHPQAGPNSWTNRFRLIMRRLADGTISYTYEDRAKAEADLPGAEVWVAPNALYRQADMTPGIIDESSERNELLYVGRFVPAKKLLLLIRGFALAAKANQELHLRLIGGGSEEKAMQELVEQLDMRERVTFAGWQEDVAALRKTYGKAFSTVSPGFAGLGLTQSLGFGVPMIVADAEKHSPEIELHNSGGVDWFSSDSPESLAKAIRVRWAGRHAVPNLDISEYTRKRYSAEAMAAGIIGALRGTPIESQHSTKDHL